MFWSKLQMHMTSNGRQNHQVVIDTDEYNEFQTNHYPIQQINNGQWIKKNYNKNGFFFIHLEMLRDFAF